MIDNTCVRCDYCGTKIRMRFQMGYFDIPFDFCCPECGVHIYGTRRIIDESSIELHNAKPIVCNLDDVDFYADFSVELPHSKIKKYVSLDEVVKNGFSPFMMTIKLFPGETYFKLIENMKNVLSFRDSMWPRIAPLYDLFFNKKIKLIREPLRTFSEKYVVHNELDAMMALHQLCIFGFSSMLPDNTINKFIELSKSIYRSENLRKLDALIDTLGGRMYFESVSKRLIRIYSRWLSDFEKYIPAVMIELGNVKESFDREKYGIATTSFENMKSFYADSYELILEMVDIAVLLNNLVVRGDHNKFSLETNIKDYSEYSKQVKSTRLKALVDDEPFSRAIPLNRKIRNAIAHYNYEFDPSLQKITFIDKYKDKEKTIEMYLIDLALLCYDNMKILIYLDELMYPLRKWNYRKSGMKVHIQTFE